MPRHVLVRIHAIAGTLALATILAFWTAAFASGFMLSADGAMLVRTAILSALPVLVLALAATGGSGFRLAGRSTSSVVRAKRRRMMIAVANGLLVLVPCAAYLGLKARSGLLDGTEGVQAIELAAGALNIGLLGYNMRDGLRMRAAKATRCSAPARGAAA